MPVTSALSGPHHAGDLRRGRGQRMRLQGDDDVVLHARLGRHRRRSADAPSCFARRCAASRRCACIAARCGPRAMKVTSAPAAASLTPRKPPIAPAPKTAIFMRRSKPELLGQADALQLAGGALGDFGQEHDLARHLESGQPRGGELAQLALVAASRPSRSTTAAATSSPSLSCGMREGDHLLPPRDGPSALSSTSSGEIFSPPRLMISFSRPVSRR